MLGPPWQPAAPATRPTTHRRLPLRRRVPGQRAHGGGLQRVGGAVDPLGRGVEAGEAGHRPQHQRDADQPPALLGTRRRSRRPADAHPARSRRPGPAAPPGRIDRAAPHGASGMVGAGCLRASPRSPAPPRHPGHDLSSLLGGGGFGHQEYYPTRRSLPASSTLSWRFWAKDPGDGGCHGLAAAGSGQASAPKSSDALPSCPYATCWRSPIRAWTAAPSCRSSR